MRWDFSVNVTPIILSLRDVGNNRRQIRVNFLTEMLTDLFVKMLKTYVFLALLHLSLVPVHLLKRLNTVAYVSMWSTSTAGRTCQMSKYGNSILL
jgi:hypothetical protein